MKFYRSNNISILLRIVAILVLCFAVVYFWLLTPYWAISLWSLVFIALITVNLIRHLEKSQREMVNFLLAIKQNDFTTSSQQSSYKIDLKYAQTQILKVFQRLNKEKESEHQYLKTVVEHVKVALVCFDEQGEVTLLNQAACELFNRPYLKNIIALKKIDPELYDLLKSLRPGQKSLIKIVIQNKLMHLSLQATAFRIKNNNYKLVSFQDIKSELEEKELESWQKLIRVMTHEIKNSAIPIATLTDVTYQQLIGENDTPKDLGTVDPEELKDIKTSLKTIASRSKGLVNFVKAYNDLTRIPPPKIKSVKVLSLLKNVEQLLTPQLKSSGIRLKYQMESTDMMIKADMDLIEQVIINVLLNAVDALENKSNPQIIISCFVNHDGKKCVEISDNGPGIPEEVLENVFVPFYTTKNQGSGIGLSLSRQIMRLHHGTIEVSSKTGAGTKVTLFF